MTRPLHLLTVLLALLTVAAAGAQTLSPDQVKHRLGMPRARLVYESEGLCAFDHDRGFVLAGKRGSRPVVLAYSDETGFGQARRNPVVRSLIKRYEQHILPEMHVYRPAGVRERVEPLCPDTWHQGDPYFRLCPVVGGDTCITGCVANAMGQVMNYYKWPARGTGTHTYTDKRGTGLTFDTDFSGHTYDWDHIKLDYYEPFSERQAQAVALLLSDCGKSVDMCYGTGSSSARSILQPRALVEHFQYDEGIQQYFRNFFPQAEWDSIMFIELSEGRPIIVSGYSEQLAHNFVCDGYDENGLFHINFGNPESDGNGYYYFTWLTPDQPQWHDVDNPETGLNVLQSILVGIKPRAGDTPQRYAFAFSHMEQLEGLRVAVHHLSNMGWNRHQGQVALALKPSGSPTVTPAASTRLLYTYQRDFLLEEIDDTTYTDTIDLQQPLQDVLPHILTTETYRIVPVYQQGNELHEVRTMVGTPNHLLCQFAPNGQATLTHPVAAEARLQAYNVVFPDTVSKWSSPPFSFDIRNDGAEYSGRLFIALYSPDQPQVNRIFCEEGLSIGTGETLHRNFKITNILTHPIGIYHLRIMVDNSLFTDSLITIYDDPTHEIVMMPVEYTAIEAPVMPTQPGQAQKNRFYGLDGRRSDENSMVADRIYLVGQDGRYRKIRNQRLR